ncbi:MAG: HAMP domain-containing protein [Oligoflexales bacterium]
MTEKFISIRKKMLLIVSLIIAVAAIFMIVGTAWSGKNRFENATQKQFDLSISLTKLTINQLLSDVKTGLNGLNNNAELSRDLITTLTAPKPRRRNFYKFFYLIYEFSKDYSLSQTTIHLKSSGRENFQIYSLSDLAADKVLSFSTKLGENGKKQIQLTRDKFGFIGRDKEAEKITEYSFPHTLRNDKTPAIFHTNEKKLFFDIQYNLVNHLIGKKKEDQESEEDNQEDNGFASLGMTYGIIRTFAELKPNFLENLEKQAGVHLDIFSNSGAHLLGNLSSNPSMDELKDGEFFSLLSQKNKYISQGSPIEVEGKKVGFLVSSVPQSQLTSEIISIAFQLIAIICITCSLGVIFISLFLTKTITNPLLLLGKSVKKLAAGELTHQAAITIHDEIGSLALSVNKMASDLNVAFHTIEDQKHNLELRVEERTKEVQEKSQNVRVMLSNLQQGVFILLAGNYIDKEYSNHLCEIMETDDISGNNLEDFLLENSDLSTDAKSAVTATLVNTIGEETIMYDLNYPNLVTELEKKVNNKYKSLEVDWNPIVNDDIVSKMMVTIRDVTELKKLQLQAMNRRRDLEIIGQIIAITPAKFKQFMTGSHKLLESSREILEKCDSPDDLNALFRNMHTIKGNSRIYNFTIISDKSHQVEVILDKLRKDPPKILPKEQLIAEFDSLKNTLQHHEKINREDLGREANSEQIDPDSVMVQLDVVSEALSLLKNINSSSIETLRNNTSLVMQHLLRIGSQPLSEMISGVTESIPSLAEELGKSIPVIKIDNTCLLPKLAISELLNDICMHIFRNAIDHGIEPENERKKLGKPSHGAINLSVKNDGEMVVFLFSDDGGGLNLKLLMERAQEKGLLQKEVTLSNQGAANLVFVPSISTASKVTKISGRGVGMDAVASFVKNYHGEIKLNLLGELKNERIPFEIEIQLPKKYFTEIELEKMSVALDA